MADVPQTVDNVPVKSAWLSKINWTQAVAGAAMVVTFVSGGQLNIDASQQAAIIVVIGVVSQVITWVWRTWFNNTVSPAVVNNATVTRSPSEAA